MGEPPKAPIDLFQAAYYTGEGRDGLWHAVENCIRARGRLRHSRLGSMLASGKTPCTNCTTHLNLPPGGSAA